MAAVSGPLAPTWLPPLSPGCSALPALSDALLGDWLLDADGDEAASAPAWSLPQPITLLASVVPPLSRAPLPLEADWRCLDPAHASSCARCVPAPAPADAGAYRLTDPSGQLAEKRLRSLLSRCPEWNDAGVRQRLAAALEAEEALSGLSSGAVEVLRSHSSAHMRKHAMLRLAYCWRYKGDCWSVRNAGSGERKRSRKPAPAAADAGEALPAFKRFVFDDAAMSLALADRTLTVSQAAQAQMHCFLAPHIASAARSWTGPLSATQYGRIRGEGMTWHRVRGMEGALEVAVWMRDVVAQRLTGLRAWRATLDAETLRSPAFFCDSAFAVPESELEAMRVILTGARMLTAFTTESTRQPDGGLLPQHAAWMYDYDQGHVAAMSMVANAHAFCASQRMESLRNYLDGAEAVLEGIGRYTRSSVESLQQRVEWTTLAAAAQGAAAGCWIEARSSLAPLVHRLRLTGEDPDGARLLALASTPPPLGSPLPRFTFATGPPPPPRPVRAVACAAPGHTALPLRQNVVY